MKIQTFITLTLYYIYCHNLISSDKNSIEEIKYNLIGNNLEPSSNRKFLKEDFSDYDYSSNIIELESDYIITQIKWTKNEDYDLNYLLGIFEGANDPSFNDPVPLGMIKQLGKFNEVNFIDINSPNTYKYIRYIPPNKNYTDISPIKVYGYKMSETIENLNERKEFQVTNLPLISIHTEDLTDPIKKGQDMNCKVMIINEGKIETKETGEIKVRGRTSGLIPTKKPYRIKFSTKQKILGLKGSYKKWILIANAFDRSLLRNALAFKISQLMKFKYTQRCTPVDVILNGVFRGNYYLCDSIEIGKNRVNITKMNNNDISEPNVSGGYLMEFDGGLFYGEKHYETEGGILFKISYPQEDEITIEQEDYIVEHLSKLEKEAYNNIFDKIDLDSFSKFFIIKEFCGDIDFLWSSFYFYKDRNDDKVYFGPAWDFDLSLDNHEALIPTNEKDFFCFIMGGSAGTLSRLIKKLTRTKYTIEYIQKVWNQLCDTVLNETVLIDFLEERKAFLKESSELNFLKWDNNFEKIPWEGMTEEDKDEDYGRKGENFEVSVQVLIDFISKRFSTFSKILNKAVLSAN